MNEADGKPRGTVGPAHFQTPVCRVRFTIHWPVCRAQALVQAPGKAGRLYCLTALLLLAAGSRAAPLYDPMADTWVATDALGRMLPENSGCGNPRANRPIGIFYFLWHGNYSYGSATNWDVTKWIAAHPYGNPFNPWASNPIFDQVPSGTPFYWGEPAIGYYHPSDPWALRRQIALLTYAGVDVLLFDYSNGVTYDAPLYALCNMIRQMRSEGFPVSLKLAFLTHFNSAATAAYLYDTFYAPGLYPELWYYWRGRPLILGDTNGAPPVVQTFFTWRASWADVGQLHDQWQWIDSATPQHWGYHDRADLPEHLPVSCGGWATTEFSVPDIGRSYANHAEPPYDNFHLPKTRTQGQGLFFSEQMFYGLKYDPQFLFITGWNEWIAGAIQSPTAGAYTLLGQPCPAGGFFFVDEYNQEFSRDIEPMRGGHTDNYYYQMVGLNRLRKGVRPVPAASPSLTINLSGDFTDWTNVSPAYYDPINDTLGRNYPSAVAQAGNYTGSTGRNDFALLKVARDADYLYFLAQCNSTISSHTGSNWMVLLIDADQDHATGWEGYDFAVNLANVGAATTTLSRNSTISNEWSWTTIRSDIAYALQGNRLMLRVPRRDLGLGPDPISFDFHWADNFQVPGDITDFGISGDSAPDRRFNYRYQAQKLNVVNLGSDDFENGKQPAWSGAWNPNSLWDLASTNPYDGSFCAECSLQHGTNNTALQVQLDPSGCTSFRISFHYKLHLASYTHSPTLSYFGTNGWVAIRDLARDQYYPARQAWGYQERGDVWLYLTDVRYNRGADAQFFTSGFALKIDGSPFTAATQSISVDDFQATGVMPDQGISSAPVVEKADNSVSLVYGQSWVGGAPPGASQIARWDETVTGDNTILLGADSAWRGLQIFNPGGPVAIYGATKLTLGGSGIDMSAAGQNLTLNASLVLGAAQSWNIASARELTVNGAISGANDLHKDGPGKLTLSGAGSFSGDMTVAGGTLNLSNASLQGNVVVQEGALLAGTGVVLGAVTAEEGATFSPGNGFGALVVSNNLRLQGTIILEIARTGNKLSNDRVIGARSVSYGGTLIVTNKGGALAAGDSFQLFGAKVYTGSFSSRILPPLQFGLYWDTSQLAINGAISVAYIPSPPLRIMPLGDSITLGDGAPGGYRLPLYQLLTKAGFTVDFVGTQNDNGAIGLPDLDHEGHSGYRIDQIDAGLLGYFGQTDDPDIILLLIGTNDYGQEYETAHAINRLEALVAKMATRRPLASIIVANLLVRGEPYNTAIQQTFNPFVPAMVARQAALGRRVYFTDLRSSVPLSDLPDTLHPDALGYQKMATNWFLAILNLFTPQGDTNAPVLAHAYGLVGLTNILVTFSKPVSDDATNVADYTVSGGVEVRRAALNFTTKRDVTLTTAPQDPSSLYTLTANRVSDRTANQIPIAPNSTIAFLSSGTGARGVFTNVPEAAAYQLIYSLDIPNAPNYAVAVPYNLDLHTNAGNFSRVAYYLELQMINRPLYFIWVSMDALTRDAVMIGVPTAGSRARFQRRVARMNVLSSFPGIVNGNKLAGGNIEFWPGNYGPDNAAGVPNANAFTFDWGDAFTDGNYGCMQLHNHEAGQVLFAFNRWAGAGGVADLGIGNRPSGGAPDWTFAQNANTYSVKRLQVLVNRAPIARCVDVVVSAGTNCLANASVDAGSFNPDGDPFTVRQLPPGPYPLGTNLVTLVVADNFGASNSCSARVIVRDTTTPALECPSNQTVEFDTERGAPVSFVAPATDLCSPPVTVVCQPPSGSMMPIGVTDVRCLATDAAGNSAACTFQVLVLGAQAVKSNVLAELSKLQSAFDSPREGESVTRAITKLGQSLDGALWLDQTHLSRRSGITAFNDEKASVQALLRSKQHEQQALSGTVQGFIDRIVKADRLLAVTAMQDAANARVAPERLAEAARELAEGDAEAGRRHYESGIDHYRNAWNLASRLTFKLAPRLVAGRLSLESSASPGETYSLEISPDLINWWTLGTAIADSNGLVSFEAPTERNAGSRFYRAKLLP